MEAPLDKAKREGCRGEPGGGEGSNHLVLSGATYNRKNAQLASVSTDAF